MPIAIMGFRKEALCLVRRRFPGSLQAAGGTEEVA
jgi:hypothetical protein